MAATKTLPQLHKKAQEVFNKYIRDRDAGLPCISCGEHRTLQAGHYVPQKNSSFLRYHEWNVNGECAGCNGFDQFHLISYRNRLIDKIGEDAVAYLELHKRTLKKWGRTELEEIINNYKSRA